MVQSPCSMRERFCQNQQKQSRNEIMKNRVILNGQGIPVVPSKNEKIAKEIAESDVRMAMKQATMLGFTHGFGAAITSMEETLKVALEKGHEAITISDA